MDTSNNLDRIARLSNKNSDPMYGNKHLRAVLSTSKIEQTIFQVAYLITQGNELPDKLSWALTIMDDVQLLSFTLTNMFYPAIPGVLLIGLEPLNALSDYATFWATNVLGLVAVFSVVITIVIVAFLMHRQVQVPIPVLQFLRACIAAIMTVLNFPLAQLFLSGLQCGSNGDVVLAQFSTTINCLGSVHLPLLILDVIGLAIFVPLLIIGAVVVIETSPTSHSPQAMAHGQVEIRSMLVRMILVVLNGIMNVNTPDGAAPPVQLMWGYMVSVAALQFYLAWALITCMPYYKRSMTTLRAALTFGSAVSMVATMFLWTFYKPTNGWIYAAVAAVVGSVIGAFITNKYAVRYLDQTVVTWHRVGRYEYQRGIHAHAPKNSVPSLTNLLQAATSTLQRNASATGGATSLPRGSSAGASDLSSPSDNIGQLPHILVSTLTRTRSGVYNPTGPSPDFPKSFSIGSHDDIGQSQPRLRLAHSNSHVIASTRHAKSLSTSLAIVQSQALYASPGGLGGPAAGRGGGGIVPKGMSELSPPHSQHALGIGASIMFPPSQYTEPPSSMSLSREAAETALQTLVMTGTSTDIVKLIRERVVRLRRVFDSPLQVEVCVRIIRKNATSTQVALGLQLLERGLVEFPNDPLLLLLAATYLKAYYGRDGEHVSNILIQSLEQSSKNIPVGIKFLIYVRERDAQLVGEDILERTAIDALTTDAKKYHKKALHALVQVWDAIKSGGGMDDLSVAVQSLAQSQRNAGNCYKRLLLMCPRDENVIRLYAHFLQTVDSDAQKATEFIDMADDLAEKRQAQLDPDMDELESPMASETRLNQRRKSGEMSADKEQSVADDAAMSQSSSQNSRTRNQLRRVISQRILRPLNFSKQLIFGFLVLAGALTCVYVYIMNFFADADVGRVELQNGHITRITAMQLLESLRYLAQSGSGLSNLPANSYATAYAQLATLTDTFYGHVSEMADLEAARSASGAFRPVPINIYFPKVQATPGPSLSTADFTAVPLVTLQVLELIQQAASLALTYDGSTSLLRLTPTIFWTLPEFRVIGDNFITIQKVIVSSIDDEVSTIVDLLNGIDAPLAGFIVGAFVFCVITIFYVNKALLRPFFDKEVSILKLLRKVPPTTAAEMIARTERAIDELTSIDASTGEEGTREPSRSVNLGASEGSSGIRQRKYLGAIAICLGIMFGLVTSLIFTAHYEGTMVHDFIRYQSSDTRQINAIQWRICSREFFYNDGVFPLDYVQRLCRSVHYDMTINHGKVLQEHSLEHDYPEFTVQMRNCSAPETGSCAAVVANDAVGFTTDLTMLPTDQEIERFLESAELSLQHMSLSSALLTTPTLLALASNVWQLSMLLSTDIQNRIEALTSGAMVPNMLDDIEGFSQSAVIQFYVDLVYLLVCAFAIHQILVKRLLHEGQALVGLLFAFTSADLAHAPEIARFLATGGLDLDVRTRVRRDIPPATRQSQSSNINLNGGGGKSAKTNALSAPLQGTSSGAQASFVLTTE
ncbi:hypothetical protein BC828DRAFT_377341 [Blastocladiella britannica]|nr:hypothetical protein BC828DRAFT_377341 [Blastocladiella britannica]